jgi:3-dehydroquinate synthase
MGDFEDLLHGECVALGMTFFTDKEILPRLKAVLKKANLPYEISADADKIIELCSHDKKKSGDTWVWEEDKENED